MKKNTVPRQVSPARHEFTLTEDEVVAALVGFLSSSGVPVPEGKRDLCGLKHGRRGPDSLTLVVTEEA